MENIPINIISHVMNKWMQQSYASKQWRILGKGPDFTEEKILARTSTIQITTAYTGSPNTLVVALRS